MYEFLKEIFKKKHFWNKKKYQDGARPGSICP